MAIALTDVDVRDVNWSGRFWFERPYIVQKLKGERAVIYMVGQPGAVHPPG